MPVKLNTQMPKMRLLDSLPSAFNKMIMAASLGCLCILLSTQAVGAAANKPSVYAVASAHPLATQAGLRILAAGGNAFDAAVATGMTLAVVEPYSSGLGGGGFWLLYRADDQQERMIDGRERAPLAAHAAMYLDDAGKVIPGLSLNGALAAAIPGMPAASAYLAKHYGRLPLAVSLSDAIHWAEHGIAVDQKMIAMLRLRKEVLLQSAAARRLFLPNGKIPELGYNIRQTDLAQTLRQIAKHGHQGFYQGQVAEKMLAAMKAAGGIWHLDDLLNYQVVERQAVRFSYRGAQLSSASLPSSGGIVLAIFFQTIQHFDWQRMSSAERIHHWVEGMRYAYYNRATQLGDMDFHNVPIKKLLSPLYGKQLAARIDGQRATASTQLDSTQQTPPPAGRDTSHFSILDKEGNRVAATLSINYPFGSGFVAAGSGIIMNNEMDDFAIKPGVANVYGLVGNEINAIAPGKRMLSSMSPTFVDDGQRLAIVGTPGGSRIISMVALAIEAFLDGEQADDIVSQKRYHHQYLPDRIEYEDGALDDETIHALRAKGHRLHALKNNYGNMQIIVWDYQNNTVQAAADPRGLGQAASSP